MKKPKMILFDYGQTLVNQQKLNGVRGTEAVLKYAVENKYNLSASQVQEEVEKINHELGRADSPTRYLSQIEVPNHMFTAYLYESLGIQLSLTSEQIDKVFWDNAAPGVPTDGIETFLEYLNQSGIRTGVISNITFAGNIVDSRINETIPTHHFKFIIATSEYLFRKPNRRIFDLALEKANLRAEEVWYIGDDYECDVAGARNAGIFPIWYVGAVDSPYEEKEDVLKIRAWKELQEWMENLKTEI